MIALLAWQQEELYTANYSSSSQLSFSPASALLNPALLSMNLTHWSLQRDEQQQGRAVAPKTCFRCGTGGEVEGERRGYLSLGGL